MVDKEASHRTVSEEEKQKLLQMSEISLWLDDYDDIFSDFDPRPYSQRSLSDDFLLEAKKAAKDKSPDKIELRFLVPSAKRSSEREGVIKKRLHEHFKKHHDILHKEMKEIRRGGLVILLGAVFTMLAASYVEFLPLSGFLSKLLFVLLEPTGWFMAWIGLERIFYTPRQRKPDLEFYEKISKSEITFTSY